MSSILLDFNNEKTRAIINNIDVQAWQKFELIVSETVSTAKGKVGFPVDQNNVHLVAHQIAIAAYKNFETWAAQTFTSYPSNTIAEAWVRGTYFCFDGEESIQGEIRRALLA